MIIHNLLLVTQWWIVLFLLGVIFLPITTRLFSSFFDKGYIFSKIIAIAVISYIIFLCGTIKILPFTQPTILIVLGFLVCINLFVFSRTRPLLRPYLAISWKIFLFEEALFLATLTFWAYIRSFQPDIHGLEKYMDYGFVNAILRSEYFPPRDMWLTPFSINYYYFGHLVTAVLTRLSFIPSAVTYNLMLSTLFAFTFTCSFSIGANLLSLLNPNTKARNPKQIQNTNDRNTKRFGFLNFRTWNLFRVSSFEFRVLFGGLLTAFLVTFGGNLHAVYTFFKPYQNENPVPIQQLAFSPNTFPNSYWYPNATRFIHNTIHEFPLYSFVVSDLHGHVIDIPFVLLIIALLLSLLNSKHEARNTKQSQNINDKNTKRFEPLNFRTWNLFRISNFEFRILLLGFLLAVMYMTNAWDGIIYALLTFMIFIYLGYKQKNYTLYAKRYTFILFCFILFSLPFSIHFKPFVSGIGILCAPTFLTNIGKLGPFLFETNHCQHSPLWQLLILYGFFYFFVLSFLLFLLRKIYTRRYTRDASDVFVLLLILLSTILIIIPEFIYVKDIYPAHYRANTMFKLVYESFIMLSIASGYIIIRLTSSFKSHIVNTKSQNSKIIGFFHVGNWRWFGFWIFGFGIFAIIAIYPYFAINSYYGNLTTHIGLDGTVYLQKLYPNDYAAMTWLNQNIKDQPVILEAQGDSYTDYGRVATHTGLPTLLGWTVHEWLWRGTYDIPSPRIAEVQTLYETSDINTAKNLIKKYNISLVFIGNLERQKYPTLNEQKFAQLGKIIYQSGQTKIYRLY